jgi:hypothetical protein
MSRRRSRTCRPRRTAPTSARRTRGRTGPVRLLLIRRSQAGRLPGRCPLALRRLALWSLARWSPAPSSLARCPPALRLLAPRSSVGCLLAWLRLAPCSPGWRPLASRLLARLARCPHRRALPQPGASRGRRPCAGRTDRSSPRPPTHVLPGRLASTSPPSLLNPDGRAERASRPSRPRPDLGVAYGPVAGSTTSAGVAGSRAVSIWAWIRRRARWARRKSSSDPRPRPALFLNSWLRGRRGTSEEIEFVF